MISLVIDHRELPAFDGYAAPSCQASGTARSRIARPEGVPQWIVTAELSAGAAISWDDQHGEEAIYVVSGRVEVGGKVSEAGAAIVLEAGAPIALTVEADASLVHIGTGSVASPPTEAPKRGVHVCGRHGVDANADDSSRIWWFATGKCPTCAHMFYRTVGKGDTPSHYHTEPQLQHVLAGRFRFGTTDAHVGMTLVIPAGQRYSYKGQGSWDVLVHRPRLSSLCYRDDELVPEAVGFDAIDAGTDAHGIRDVRFVSTKA